MIPAGRVNPGQQKLLMEYLVEELRRAQGARQQLEKYWIRYHELYRARPKEEEKTFPFRGASNLTIAVMATDLDTIFARLMGLLWTPKNLWSVTARRPEFEVVAPRVQEFLQWAQEEELELYEPISDWILELCKLGTAVLKQRYTRESQKVFEWRELENGQVWQQQVQLLLHDHPSVHHVRLFDFYVPPGSRNVKTAPWAAERIGLTWQQYLNRVRAGVYYGVEGMQSWHATQRGSQTELAIREQGNFAPRYGDKFEFFEFWLNFDIDGDGQEEALVCTIHPDSQSYVRLDYNPFFNQEKPYSAARYLRVEGEFYGIGLGEMLDYSQEAVTAMTNQRIDSGTLANSLMLVGPKNGDLEEEEPVYPGRIWLTQNPGDIKTLYWNNKDQNSLPAENQLLQHTQRRTGANDYIHGQNSPEIGYGTAYTTQQMMQNVGKRFDQIQREIHQALSETGTRTLELYQQFNQRGKEFFVMGDTEGALVHTVLQFPVDLIRRGMIVGVTALDASTTKDAAIRNNQLIAQQLLAYYQQSLQFLQYAVNPQMPPPIQQFAIQALQGSTVMIRRVLDSYGIQDLEKMIPELMGGLDVQQQQLAALQALGRGGAAPLALPPGSQGMGAVPPGSNGVAGPAGSYAGNGNGAAPVVQGSGRF